MLLAENLSAYRALRNITQDMLAARMTAIGHSMTRSTISAIEGGSRGVTVDELFGLAITIGVTIGQLLDATGPTHSRSAFLDVGLRTSDGSLRPVAPWLAHLLAMSRAFVRLPPGDGAVIEIHPATSPPEEARRALNEVRSLLEGGISEKADPRRAPRPPRR